MPGGQPAGPAGEQAGAASFTNWSGYELLRTLYIVWGPRGPIAFRFTDPYDWVNGTEWTSAGVVSDGAGTIYYNLLSGDPARSGIWRLRPGGSPERIGALPAGQFLNGLTIDAAGENLYAADSLAGAIWTVPTSGGPVKAWLVTRPRSRAFNNLSTHTPFRACEDGCR